ncbi:cytochrome c oxidase assembly factor Coa1 family protein [Pseudoxanthomonas sp. SL93]|uniref:cytochrome c oxidase assembly factor Coa1 family protein n=1 Tax=Pseudoxanthomonas sp. SL93 TaxID=2995142 RepID=UPI00227204F4|nr:cytochrome c oxidase assembly factor Coa1 family protein [Pseudoxanthomonas sp. SL93]WAC62244.1 cytochrome c oxidase assembly factor Coa1 family protein [Pseudoxanthomonas sp. SL93]
MQTTTPPATWWSRNWKWCVPVLAALLLALFAAFIFGILALVFGAMKSSGPYQHAMARAQADPAVTAALGTPIQAGWLVQGNFSSNGPDGEANLSIPLDGPKADGTLFVVAKKHAGEWRYETLAVNVEGGERIVLAEEARDPEGVSLR